MSQASRRNSMKNRMSLLLSQLFFFCFPLFVFETEPCYVAGAGLEHAVILPKSWDYRYMLYSWSYLILGICKEYLKFNAIRSFLEEQLA